MALKSRIIRKAARAYNKVRPRVMPAARYFLLKREGQTKRFAVVQEVTSAQYVGWNSYREQMQFKLASETDELADLLAQTSYIAYGVPNTAKEIDVFAISSEARDRIPPTGTSPFWKLFGVRQPEMRFAIPE
jgi:hypothetical protein